MFGIAGDEIVTALEAKLVLGSEMEVDGGTVWRLVEGMEIDNEVDEISTVSCVPGEDNDELVDGKDTVADMLEL